MKPNAIVSAANVKFGNALPLSLIAGPCQMESRDHAFMMAGRLKEICGRLGIGLVYKSSFDKANRTSLTGKRGMGLDKSLAVFADIRKELGLPVLTDVHENGQCAELATVVDVLQIPAFLCRQTDLLIAAAKTGRIVNVKKGQFLAPWDMKNVLAKIVESGNPNVMLCPRGTTPTLDVYLQRPVVASPNPATAAHWEDFYHFPQVTTSAVDKVVTLPLPPAQDVDASLGTMSRARAVEALAADTAIGGHWAGPIRVREVITGTGISQAAVYDLELTGK